MTARLAAAGFIAAVVLIAAGCGPGAATQVPSAAPTIAQTPRPPDLPIATPPSVATQLPGATPLPVTAVAPAILETVVAEAARLSNVSVDQVTILRAEPAVWADGSLGCPQQGEMYTQALVNGYWIILQVGTTPYDFRVASDGTFRVCPHPESSNPADNY